MGLFLLFFAVVPAFGNSCTFSHKGVEYDFSPIYGKVFTASSDRYNYKVSICGQPAIKDCNGVGCQYNKGKHLSTLASTSNIPTYTLLNEGGAQSGLKYVARSGDTCRGGFAPRVMTIEMPCDPSAGYGELRVKNDRGASCTEPGYVFDFPTACSCPGGCGPMIGGGWKFILFLIVGFIVYVSLGCIYNRKKNETSFGMESFPNKPFWRDFPNLVKDGCVFSHKKILEFKARANQPKQEAGTTEENTGFLRDDEN